MPNNYDMKFFDCNNCKHKQNYSIHCLFYKQKPSFNICPTYCQENIVQENYNINKEINKKASELLNDFGDLDYTFDDWCDIIKGALYLDSHANHSDSNKIFFVKDFGNNGLLFSCNKCENIVELTSDTEIKCPNCDNKFFTIVLD